MVRDGSTTAGEDLTYQYAPTQPGSGFIKANWDAHPNATAYRVSIGTAPGSNDVVSDAAVGNVTSWTATGLSLQGAHTGAVYFVSVTPVLASGSGAPHSSNGVRIAEGDRFTGAANEFGTIVTRNDKGGFSRDFPAGSGINAIYGDHYFETVDIPAGTTVYVQPFGKEDSVGENAPANDARVTTPKDGWVRLYANRITVNGMIDARGRGYGGGGGAGSEHGPTDIAHGGMNGLSGNGGDCYLEQTLTRGGDGLGAGGGGANCIYSPQGFPGYRGGNGGVRGGGGYGAGKYADTMGIQGSPDNALGGHGNPDGSGERGGGGGGGYGAGGGGASSPYGGGGGGGGTGGSHGESTVYHTPCPGGSGAGPAAGAGGDQARLNNGEAGFAGGYRAPGVNGDSSTDETVFLGSGGGGGSRHDFEGGGGGGAGGGAIMLVGAAELVVHGRLLASGAAGGGGGLSDAWNTYAGAGGGGGGGGGILLKAPRVDVTGGTVRTMGGLRGEDTPTGAFSGKGGDGDASTANGGTIKVFRAQLSGSLDAGQAGRIFEANLNLAPVADAGGPYAGNAGVVLDGNGSTDDSGAITQFAWDLDGDGAFDDATGAYAVFAPSAEGTYTVKLRVTNALGLTSEDSAQVTIANAASTALPDAYAVDEDGTLDVPASMGVLVNDVDAEGDMLTARLVTNVANGVLQLRDDGGFHYVPRAGFSGSDSFTYEAFDGTSASAAVAVTITVRPDDDPTSAGADAYETQEDSTLHVAASEGVLANDVDDGATPLRAELARQPLHGSVMLETDGAFHYEPAANFNGEDRFTYRAIDATGPSEEVTVTITVLPVPDAPRITFPRAGASFTAMTSLPLRIQIRATDPDGDAVTFGVENLPAGATLNSATGNFSWTPTDTQLGTYTLTLTASDGVQTGSTQVSVLVTALDTDHDGISDAIEHRLGLRPDTADTDEDLISDNDEATDMIHPEDTDGDGIADALDIDADNDHILDSDEAGDRELNTAPVDSDGDGAPDFRDTDSDNDGLSDMLEAGDTIDDTLPADTDEDGVPDFADTDSDDDGLPDAQEAVMRDGQPRDSDFDDVPDYLDKDSDDDGVMDADEARGGVKDTDGDGTPDHLDTDSDDDGVPDIADNCRTLVNVEQEDLDGDGLGNACDDDLDGDGIANARESSLGLDPAKPDTDGDGIWDDVEVGPDENALDTDGDGTKDALDEDSDGDGASDLEEQAGVSTPLFDTDEDGFPDFRDRDSDDDGILDGEDNCRIVANGDQLNDDGDATGNACQGDFDRDGIVDERDNCPTVKNPDQLDTDKDGEGDLCDPDDDEDGHEDGHDNCPLIANPGSQDSNRDGLTDPCTYSIDDGPSPDAVDVPPTQGAAPDLQGQEGCSCSGGTSTSSAMILVVGAWLLRRRRR